MGLTERTHFQPGIPIDLLLLAVLVGAHLWFNPVSNAVAVGAFGIYLLLSFLAPHLPDEVEAPTRAHRYLFLLRLAIIFFYLLLAVVLPTGLNIAARREEGPHTNAHDGQIQTEAAIDFLLDGENPYREDYLDTPMAILPEPEPPWTQTDAPLYHNAYLPFLFLASLPLHQISEALLGWYDQRFFYLLLYGGAILMLPLLVRRQRAQLSLLIAAGLNLLFPLFVSEGRNDIVVFFGLLLTTVLLWRGRVRLSAVALGLTAMTKHSAWLFFPFYFLYLLPRPLSRKSIGAVVRKTWPLFATMGAIAIPFLLWDAAAFIDDTFLYLVGLTEKSFPVRGMGFSVLLIGVGVMESAEASFPFFIFQALFALPILLWLLRRQWGHNSLRNVWLGFAIFSFVFDYFSRFFHDNYLAFLLEALIVGAFIYSGPRVPKVAGSEEDAVREGEAV